MFHRNTRDSSATLITALTLGLGAAACGGPMGSTAGNTLTECRPLQSTSTTSRPPGWTGTVFTVVMENHDRDQIIGNAAAPYINQLAREHAVAAGYHDSFVHPSEPNYIWMIAGENFGILNDNDPGRANTIASTSHLADQLEAAGLSWKTYQESMGVPCRLQSAGLYAAKHNPFIYFNDINGWNGTSFSPGARCTDHVVDYTHLDADLAAGTVPDYVFITPNMIHDMHDGSIGDGDTWLAAEVPKILASTAYQNGGVLFLLWDEGGSDGDVPPFIAISPNAKQGYVSHVDYDTSSFLKTVQGIFGLEPLPCVPDPSLVSTMDDLFTVPVTAPGTSATSI